MTIPQRKWGWLCGALWVLSWSNPTWSNPAGGQTPGPTAGANQAVEKKSSRDWPLFRGDARCSGTSSGVLPDKLSLLWKYRVQDGAFEATAAIVDGVAYLGDMDGVLHAIDLETGKARWTRTMEDSGFVASPAVRDGLLYLGDLYGRFYCLDTEQGRSKWSFETEAEINSSANFYADSVLVGSQDSSLYCLDAKRGTLKWKHQIEDQIRCTPTVVDNRAFLAGCDARLHIVDLDKGVSVAGVDLGAPTGVTPAVAGERVFFGTEGGAFFGVNWKKAKTDWTYEDTARSLPYRSSAAVNERLVVVGCQDRQVRAFRPQDGKLLWTFAAKRRVDCSPVIAGNRVYVGSSDGRFYVLDSRRGEKLWEYEAGGGFAGSPAVADSRLVIASVDGIVYCFGAKPQADR